jgi:DNA transformation protein and related proteins
MVTSDSLAEFLRELLAPLGCVTMRGCSARQTCSITDVFYKRLMLGVVTVNTLYVWVNDHN